MGQSITALFKHEAAGGVIIVACWSAVKLGLAKLLEGVSWLPIYAVSILCGMGFTMSLFVGSLAFEGYSSEYLDSVKIGVLSASLFSACLGAFIIWLCRKKQEQ
jgi:NhaA family Na+:H+ antiporter